MQLIVKFGLVGIISTIIYFVIATFFIFIYKLDSLVANWLAFGCAFIFSYFGHSKLVFKKEIKSYYFFKFLTVSILSLLLITIISYSGKINNFNNYLVIIAISIFIPIMSFFIHKYWTYKDK